MPYLSGLFIYPVKSCAGIALGQSELDKTGLRYDRRWMIVQPSGAFITQRTHPQMALIQPQIDGQGQLSLTHPQLPMHTVPSLADLVQDEQSLQESLQTMAVRVWKDTVKAVYLSAESDAWLTRALGADCHLVYYPDDVIRQVDLKYAQEGDQTGFSDGFPLLMISEASLRDLNQRLVQPVPMKRFRPNLVIADCQPYAEDTWQQIRLGDITMRVVKPCSRCVITTVKPETGKRAGADPLKTLYSYRRQGDKAFFGQNVLHDGFGQLNVGDQLVTDKP